MESLIREADPRRTFNHSKRQRDFASWSRKKHCDLLSALFTSAPINHLPFKRHKNNEKQPNKKNFLHYPFRSLILPYHFLGKLLYQNLWWRDFPPYSVRCVCLRVEEEESFNDLRASAKSKSFQNHRKYGNYASHFAEIREKINKTAIERRQTSIESSY